MGEGEASQRNDDQLKFVFFLFLWLKHFQHELGRLEFSRQI